MKLTTIALCMSALFLASTSMVTASTVDHQPIERHGVLPEPNSSNIIFERSTTNRISKSVYSIASDKDDEVEEPITEVRETKESWYSEGGSNYYKREVHSSEDNSDWELISSEKHQKGSPGYKERP